MKEAVRKALVKHAVPATAKRRGLLFGLLLDQIGLGVLAVSSGLGLATGSIAVVARAERFPAPTCCRHPAWRQCVRSAAVLEAPAFLNHPLNQGFRHNSGTA